jgi:hypothetical protein
MGLFDFVSSIGGKLASGDIAGVGQKLWSGANAIGSKVSDVGHMVVDSDLGKVAIGAALGPEAIGMASGALSSFDQGLKASKSGENTLNSFLKPKPKDKAPSKPPRPTAPPTGFGTPGYRLGVPVGGVRRGVSDFPPPASLRPQIGRRPVSSGRNTTMKEAMDRANRGSLRPVPIAQSQGASNTVKRVRPSSRRPAIASRR